MKLENQVTSLELSKKLKELGVKQESYFWWIAPENNAKWPAKLVYKTGLGAYYENGAGVNEKTFELAPVLLSAFTVAELGEMLPWRSKKMGTVNNAELISTKLVNTATKQTIWTVAYWDEDKDLYSGMVHREDADTEVDARAKMLIYLIENKLIAV